MKEIYIDATDTILGRLATYCAKNALLGSHVKIFNCERVAISGDRHLIIQRNLTRMKRGNPVRGPFISRMPDRYVRRIIRGMLPYKKSKGREAFERVQCYIGVPENFKDKKMATVEGASISKLPNLKYVYIKELCRLLGAKILET